MAGPTKARGILSPLGVSNIRTLVDRENPHRVGLVMDVDDLDALLSALADPPPEFAEAM